jgi:cell division ATPase FtsA
LFVSAKELLEKIRPTVEKIKKKTGLVGGIVLTGGTVSLDGFLELSQEQLASPVRLGITRKLHGPKEVLSSPMYSSVAGVLGYIADRYKRELETYSTKPFLVKKIMQAKEWIQEYF